MKTDAYKGFGVEGLAVWFIVSSVQEGKWGTNDDIREWLNGDGAQLKADGHAPKPSQTLKEAVKEPASFLNHTARM